MILFADVDRKRLRRETIHMVLNWRETLGTLLEQFQARAVRSTGINHLFVEVADNERDKMSGPPWFSAFSREIPLVDEKPQFTKWDVSASHGMPGISPGFRATHPHETFDKGTSERVVRDGSGVVRAVGVPMKLRQGYYCGQPSEEIAPFKALANVAATALAGARDLDEHMFASDLTDLFRKPRGGIRYDFGEVPSDPPSFRAQGWAAGVHQYRHGVLIDVPISESTPDASHWLFLLHRLGWRHVDGSGLRGERYAWNKRAEVTLELLAQNWSQHPEAFSKQFSGISKESFYSVLGTKDAPLDVNLASVFAIQLLLAEMSTEITRTVTSGEPAVDYSQEEWWTRPLPKLRPVNREDCEGVIKPMVGILCATEVERQAVLKRMSPPKKKQAVLQVHEGNNTCFLGRLGVTDIVLCMAAMGSSGRDASTVVTGEIIRSWKLRAVIMVGIAFGRDSKKQEIGTVLVSERIAPYEPQRVGKSNNEDRGGEVRAGAMLLNRFRNVAGWEFCSPNGRKCEFQTGLLLSGEKLVDNLEFKKQLLNRYPAAIGGEMEGTGVAASAERERCEWIVVKAICDWGDGEKLKVHQGFAAAASVDLVEHVLKQPGVLESL